MSWAPAVATSPVVPDDPALATDGGGHAHPEHPEGPERQEGRGRRGGWARSLDADLRAGDPTGRLGTLLGRAAFGLALVGIVSLFVVGPSHAPRPTLVGAGTVLPAPGFPTFEQVTVAVVPGPNLPAQTHAACFLLASSEAQRDRGLMGVRSLGRYAGMAFTFAEPTTDVFYMAGTPMPLSIAWFSADGRFIASADMVPCPAATLHCPYTASPSPYTSAIEVPRGGLPGMGVGPGSVVQIGGPCIGG